MDGLGIGQTGRSAARTTRTNTPSPIQAQSLVASQSGKTAHKSLPQIAPAGRHGFRDDTENSDQEGAIDELVAMHVTKGPYLSSTMLRHEQHSRALNRLVLQLESDF